MENHSNTKRLAKNTIMLYFRQILIILVTLYTVRVVLNVLGAEDYGIYNVVAGVVTMFSFLSNSMASASQRYFSYDLGKDDNEHLKVTFSITMQIYMLLIAIVLIIAETLGIWFVRVKLVIPSERMSAAMWIYQGAIVSFVFTLITAPYMAVIIAHENMDVYAYVSIIEAALKLGIVFVLKILPFDKLIVYGLLLALVSIINTSLYRLYCHFKYKECNFHFYKDKALFKEIVSYSSWNLFGNLASMLRNQGQNIILNMFFGPVVNAARGIAFQVNNAIVSFATNFSNAMKPQIIKNYAAGKKDESVQLVFRGSKFTFFLLYIFILPLVLEMNYVLTLWLKNPPENAVLFTRLVLFDALIESTTYQIMALAHATGKIKRYTSIVGGCLLLNLPIAYVILRLGFPAYSVFIVSIVLGAVAYVLRLFMVKVISGCFEVGKFFLHVVIPCIICAIISMIVSYLFTRIMHESFLRLCLTVLISAITTLTTAYFIGLNKDERVAVITFIRTKVGKRK